jgi:hypothetical protein
MIRRIKKNYFFSIGIVLVFAACGLAPSSTTIINKSSYNVSFQVSYEDKRIEKLSCNSSTSINYFHTGIIIVQPEKRVRQNRDDHAITISDLPSWEVHAENKTDNPLTLTANG